MSKNEVAAAMQRTTAKTARRDNCRRHQCKPSVWRRRKADQ